MKNQMDHRSLHYRLDKLGLSSFEAPPHSLAGTGGHIHTAIEISAFKHGAVTMLYGGAPVEIEPDRLVVHWGMLPHRVIEREEQSTIVGIHLPLAWILQWNLPGQLLARLLGLELFIEPRRDDPGSDLTLIRNWLNLLKEESEVSKEIVLLEARARLLRLSRSLPDAGNHFQESALASHGFSKALEYIVRHFQEPIRLDGIAKAAGISSRHLRRLFLQNTGESVNTYISHLRLSHATRLLATTSRTVTDIMHDSGFSCTTHFYKVFREQTGCTPQKYRKEHLS